MGPDPVAWPTGRLPAVNGGWPTGRPPVTGYNYSVLADVVELDWNGSPKPRDEVLAATPVRGQLRIEPLWTDRDLERPRVHADLQPIQLETLYSVRIERWRGRNLLLAGWQRQPAPGRQTGGARFAQRWWVRLVLDANEPPMSWRMRQAVRRDRG